MPICEPFSETVGICRPSASSDVTFQVPCSLSRSVDMAGKCSATCIRDANFDSLAGRDVSIDQNLEIGAGTSDVFVLDQDFLLRAEKRLAPFQSDAIQDRKTFLVALLYQFV